MTARRKAPAGGASRPTWWQDVWGSWQFGFILLMAGDVMVLAHRWLMGRWDRLSDTADRGALFVAGCVVMLGGLVLIVLALRRENKAARAARWERIRSAWQGVVIMLVAGLPFALAVMLVGLGLRDYGWRHAAPGWTTVDVGLGWAILVFGAGMLAATSVEAYERISALWYEQQDGGPAASNSEDHENRRAFRAHYSAIALTLAAVAFAVLRLWLDFTTYKWATAAALYDPEFVIVAPVLLAIGWTWGKESLAALFRKPARFATDTVGLRWRVKHYDRLTEIFSTDSETWLQRKEGEILKKHERRKNILTKGVWAVTSVVVVVALLAVIHAARGNDVTLFFGLAFVLMLMTDYAVYCLADALRQEVYYQIAWQDIPGAKVLDPSPEGLKADSPRGRQPQPPTEADTI